MNRRLFILAALALTGCATVPVQQARTVAPRAGFEELEPLYAAHAGRDALTIRVSSNGCTSKDDFAFFVERKGGSPALAFGRKRLDSCKSFVAGHTDLTFSWSELGLAQGPVLLLNPLVAWTGPGE